MDYNEFYVMNMERKFEQKKYARELKEDKGCEICGQRLKHSSLTFHHIDMSKKFLGVSQLYCNFYMWSVLLREIAKCLVACTDCHEDLHKNHSHLC